MRPWVHRVSYPSTALQYIADIFLNLLIGVLVSRVDAQRLLFRLIRHGAL
jgi:hypothetical protein